MNFRTVIEKYRKSQFSKQDLGRHFERLVQAFLLTYQVYDGEFENVWLWSEFPYRHDFGSGQDVGIDIVCETTKKEYWAVQCKCYSEDTTIEKSDVDTFLSSSGKRFNGETRFSHRLWISTTNNWSFNAEESLKNQVPDVQRLNLNDLESARVDWDKLDEGIFGINARLEKFDIRDYQKEAKEAVHNYFKTCDRGKLIMACGTGKTFLALKIAEYETNNRGIILVLTPSISLISQTLRTWCEQCDVPIHPVCICSDSSVSKKKRSSDDSDVSLIDLALPASTNPDNIRRQISRAFQSNEGMIVVFSTYQSIDVISNVQKNMGFEFDLIICDEAHRTTGVTLADDNESSFVKVHDDTFLKSKKRLYMTATPRLYRDVDKKKAELRDAVLCSMDDERLYGSEMYNLSFGDAVDRGLLSDYKVLVFMVDASGSNDLLIEKPTDSSNVTLNADDDTKLRGCCSALSKQIVDEDGNLLTSDPSPMKRAVAFCQNIATSRDIKKKFKSLQDERTSSLSEDSRSELVKVDARHIDGTMCSTERDRLLNWLKNDDIGDNSECRILTNVRCLSEGVDVPSLDAVLFLSPRKSKIDIVQSVGRVMRRSPGKKYGYVVIPLVIPPDVDPAKELDKNAGNYKVIWDVLNALRSHDERLAIEIERIKLDKKKSDRILIGRPATEFKPNFVQTRFSLFSGLRDAIYVRAVEKVGERQYWENWASKVVDIAAKHEYQIRDIVENDIIKGVFSEFVENLRDIINPHISDDQVIEMLSQHLITKPIFETLFESYSFSANNPVSIAMQKMIQILEKNAFKRETKELDKFYKSVRDTIRGLKTSEGRQAVLIRLYDNFFRIAFPKMVEQLGIVYTPVEIVDFILHSVNDILKREFGKSLSDPGVNILDPFTGTGTFIARLLESENLIKSEDLGRKYYSSKIQSNVQSEIYANEIVLLAYYIASINIENAYHSRMSNASYTAFPGMCLTDTFQMTESKEKQATIDHFKEFKKIRERISEQTSKQITVIVGNPPYSVGQKSANDNAQNQEYPDLEKKIKETYVMDSNVTQKKAVYDSYVKAFRWATDRLDKSGGVIGFITNGGWLDSSAMDGFRKHLAKDFSNIYVFNLRGNQRTSGELLKKEGERIFPGIRVSPTIVILVKNPDFKNNTAKIYYHDIGDYLTRKEKFDKIKAFGSVCNPDMKWEIIHPNEAGDWINQRNSVFTTYYPLGDKKGNSDKAVFIPRYSLGLNTARDAWCYNSSKVKLLSNIQRSIEFYNSQVDDFKKAKLNRPGLKAEDFVTYDSTKFSWDMRQKLDLFMGKKYISQERFERIGLYRPYFKQNVYFNRNMNNSVYLIPQIFPTPETQNLVICISGIGAIKEFSALIADVVPNLDTVGKSQCFPLYYYESIGKEISSNLPASQTSLFVENRVESEEKQYVRRDGISDYILNEARSKYSQNVTKEDIFYYVYGLLHSKEYRTAFSADLKKILARIPLVDNEEDFWTFSRGGRELADLHLHYEKAEPYPGVKVTGVESQDFRVQKMRFIKKGDKSSIQYNASITVSNIPAKAYNYVVNGKSAIEWVMERYAVTVDKDTHIVNDSNDWSEEHGNPRYILDLLLSVITVSMKTMEIVENLPIPIELRLV